MKVMATIASSVLMAVAGCDLTSTNGPGPTIDDTSSKTNDIAKTSVCAVVVGMENSKFAGSCPGAKYDSERMYDLISQYSADVTLLQDSAATKSAIVAAMQRGVAKAGDGLFVLYYSGHGGSEPFPDTGLEETDGSDEFLCPWDTYLRDNEIWSIISKSQGRVYLLFDCCHSRTMFRSPTMTFSTALPVRATWTESGSFSMQCWSGCPDNTYSYGSDTGGKFTNSFLKHFKDGMTYDELWKKMEADTDLRRYEVIQRTLIGKSFGGNFVFR